MEEHKQPELSLIPQDADDADLTSQDEEDEYDTELEALLDQTFADVTDYMTEE
jgi:hypothetical protein